MNNAQTLHLNTFELNLIKKKTQIDEKIIYQYFEQFIKKFPSGFMTYNQFNDLLNMNCTFNENWIETDDDNYQNKIIQEIKSNVIRHLFNICDENDDGEINFYEYFVLFWWRINENLQNKLALTFEIFDHDNSGFINFHEMHEIVKILCKAADSGFKLKSNEMKVEFIPTNDTVLLNSRLEASHQITFNLLKKLDSNLDGKLRKEEFISGCLKYENIRNFLLPIKSCEKFL